MSANDTPMDWDSPIENDGEGSGEFFVFPDGSEVSFEVTKFTRAVSDRRNCPMAKLELTLTDGEGHEAKAWDNITLHSSSEWKLCQFFTAIGQRRHGEKIKPDWTKVYGAKGRATVTVGEYTKGSKTFPKNEIDRYLDPADAADDSSAADEDDPVF